MEDVQELAEVKPQDIHHVGDQIDLAVAVKSDFVDFSH